jgi:predicted alpha/beta-fold hydrolase
MFDELYTAPHWDFKNALDYYHHASSLYDLGRLKQNVNIIYAEDDPIIDPAPFKSLSSNSKVKLNSYPKAGHVAFYQWSKNQTILQKKILDIIGVN